MFHRDFPRSGRWHKLQTGDPGAAFYFLQAPFASSITDTSVIIDWTTNVVAQGYVEWATTAGALGGASDSTNAPGEESFSYAHHAQSIGPLSPATTYYFRVITTDQQGRVLTSTAASFATSGTQPPPNEPDTVGPRYDLYGAGASGDFPALGTEPNGGTAVAWTDSNVYVVPDSVWNASNKASALASWVRNSVPNGASAANPSYVVFDRSHNGQSSTQYGSGTLYDFSQDVKFTWPGGTKRSNITLWGYNTKLRWSSSFNAPLMWFEGGGWENLSILGFESQGPGSSGTGAPSPTVDMRSQGASEDQKHINIIAWSGLKIMDNYWHHGADFVALREWALDANHYNAWSHGPYCNDAEIAYNEGYWSMNQGFVVSQGWNIDIHHNHVHDTRQTNVDMEDNNYNAVGSPARRIVNYTIRDNRFGNWAWQPATNPINCASISFEQADGRIDAYENIEILDNEWYGGPQASMNPTYDSGSNTPSSVINRKTFLLSFPPGWQTFSCPPCTALTVDGNVSFLPGWAVAQDASSSVAMGFSNVTSLTVTNNNFQGIDMRYHGIGSLTQSNNNGSTLTSY